MNGSCLVRNRAFIFVTCCHIFSAMVCSTWCSPDVVGRRNQAHNTTRSTRRTCSGQLCRVKPSGDRHTHARALQDNCCPRDFRRPCPQQACSSSFFFKSHVGIRFQEICTEVCIVHFMRMICSKAVARLHQCHDQKGSANRHQGLFNRKVLQKNGRLLSTWGKAAHEPAENLPVCVTYVWDTFHASAELSMMVQTATPDSSTLFFRGSHRRVCLCGYPVLQIPSSLPLFMVSVSHSVLSGCFSVCWVCVACPTEPSAKKAMDTIHIETSKYGKPLQRHSMGKKHPPIPIGTSLNSTIWIHLNLDTTKKESGFPWIWGISCSLCHDLHDWVNVPPWSLGWKVGNRWT